MKRNEAKNLWKKVWADFDLDIAGQEILRVACFSLDAYLKAKDTLEDEGYTFKTGTQIRKHPMAEVLKDNPWSLELEVCIRIRWQNG